MSTCTINSGIRDNHRRGVVGDFLREYITPDSSLAVVSAYFTVHAYAELKAQLDQIASTRFLFGEPRFVRAVDPDKSDKKVFVIDAILGGSSPTARGLGMADGNSNIEENDVADERRKNHLQEMRTSWCVNSQKEPSHAVRIKPTRCFARCPCRRRSTLSGRTHAGKGA